jgi:hypothetical protein
MTKNFNAAAQNIKKRKIMKQFKNAAKLIEYSIMRFREGINYLQIIF